MTIYLRLLWYQRLGYQVMKKISSWWGKKILREFVKTRKKNYENSWVREKKRLCKSLWVKKIKKKTFESSRVKKIKKITTIIMKDFCKRLLQTNDDKKGYCEVMKEWGWRGWSQLKNDSNNWFFFNFDKLSTFKYFEDVFYCLF